jgi:hypothetical protein
MKQRALWERSSLTGRIRKASGLQKPLAPVGGGLAAPDADKIRGRGLSAAGREPALKPPLPVAATRCGGRSRQERGKVLQVLYRSPGPEAQECPPCHRSSIPIG